MLSEIANLKNIINRFSEFSKMPQPQLQNVSLADLISGVVKVYQPQLQKLKIECRTEFPAEVGSITADPDLLHRALSNLVLNAIEAMPDGGKLELRTSNVIGFRTDRGLRHWNRTHSRRMRPTVHALLHEQVRMAPG